MQCRSDLVKVLPLAVDVPLCRRKRQHSSSGRELTVGFFQAGIDVLASEEAAGSHCARVARLLSQTWRPQHPRCHVVSAPVLEIFIEIVEVVQDLSRHGGMVLEPRDGRVEIHPASALQDGD